MPPDIQPGILKALINSRRDICVGRCPLGEKRCQAWRQTSGKIVEDANQFCPEGMWHEYLYNRERRKKCQKPSIITPVLGKRGRIARGPGTMLKMMLGKIGIRAGIRCKCNERARIMDRNGIEWCEENMEQILDWLKEEADERKMPFVRLAATQLVRFAIRKAKKWKADQEAIAAASVQNAPKAPETVETPPAPVAAKATVAPERVNPNPELRTPESVKTTPVPPAPRTTSTSENPAIQP